MERKIWENGVELKKNYRNLDILIAMNFRNIISSVYMAILGLMTIQVNKNQQTLFSYHKFKK
jgi:hypothetical protein